MPTAGSPALTAPSTDNVVQAAWRLIEAADTRCIGQVESPGFQALLRRVREASREGPSARPAVASVEELAQLLALWRPGAAGLTNEASYLAARFGGQRPAYFHPAVAPILDPTYGALLFTDQVAEVICLLGFDFAFADRFRRALATGRRAQRIEMERERILHSAIDIATRRVIVDRTFYYDAIDDAAPESEAKAMQDYLQRIEALDEVRVGNLGWLKRSPKRGRQQKAVDVQLAVDATEWAFTRRDGAIAIVAGDGDFTPLVDAIRRAGPYALVLAFDGGGLAQSLADAADRLVKLPTPDEHWVLPAAPPECYVGVTLSLVTMS